MSLLRLGPGDAKVADGAIMELFAAWDDFPTALDESILGIRKGESEGEAAFLVDPSESD